MKIIEHGDYAKRPPVRFVCPNCGCVFEASWGEYSVVSSQREGAYYCVMCPECKQGVNKPKCTGQGG